MEELLRAHVKVTAMDAAVALYCCHYGATASGPSGGQGEPVEINWEKLMEVFKEIEYGSTWKKSALILVDCYRMMIASSAGM